MTWFSRSWPPAELSSTVAFMTPTKSLGGPTNVLSRSPPVSTQPARPREVPSDSSVPSTRPAIDGFLAGIVVEPHAKGQGLVHVAFFARSYDKRRRRARDRRAVEPRAYVFL